MEECMQGIEIRRTWSEKEMVCAFGGQMFAGTPDGMFEAWDGALTCVQVVRVPLTREMNPNDLEAALALTVVTKTVKSQQWLRATHATPADFIIFCWLPFTIPDVVADSADALMQRITAQDPRFSLRIRVPCEPGGLFPALFASPGQSRRACKRFSESDVSTFSGEEQSDEEDDVAWDITWAWDSDWEGSNEELYGNPIVIAEHAEAETANVNLSRFPSEPNFDGNLAPSNALGGSVNDEFSAFGFESLGQSGSSQRIIPPPDDVIYVWDDSG